MNEKKKMLQWAMNLVKGNLDVFPDEEIKQFAEEMNTFLYGVFPQSKSELDIEQVKESLFTVQKTLASFLREILLTERESPHIKFLDSVKPIFSIVEGCFSLGHQHSDIEATARYRLASLLDGLPSDVLGVCPQCRRLFINVTGRFKRFCAPPCTMKYYAQRQYEIIKADPKRYKAHLKKHQQLSKRRYRHVKARKQRRIFKTQL
ncbi:MAG: hypothetical protein FJ115_05360 [Deltaproteobacteria bacterium]|nr:hypothetical protein [Deltaproteobacteria bacterium]